MYININIDIIWFINLILWLINFILSIISKEKDYDYLKALGIGSTLYLTIIFFALTFKIVTLN